MNLVTAGYCPVTYNTYYLVKSQLTEFYSLFYLKTGTFYPLLTKWDPTECTLYCTCYTFCIGLMMADLRPKHVPLVMTDIIIVSL